MVKSLVGETFGKYEVNKLLGKGGMGEVYEAFDTDKGRKIALKVLPEEYADDETFRTRFLRESRAAAILDEPHVIPIHDWGEIDHTLYIDMRLVQGPTLHELLQQKQLRPQRAVAIIRQVAEALDAAHAKGLIHRDVKPQNIIVAPTDFAYLLDFGIAEAPGDTHLTVAGCAIGSFAYMAPERFDERESTSAVDVYSLTCVLYEALTGRPPFTGNSHQLMAAHLTSAPPRPSVVNAQVPAALDDVIARGMAKEPDDRYGSAGALARAAKRALSSTKSQTGASGAGFVPPQPEAPTQQAYFESAPRFDVAFPPPERSESTNRYLLPTLVVIAAALVVAVVALVVNVVSNQKSDSGGSSPTVAYPTSASPTYQAPDATTVTQTVTQPSYQTPTRAPETTSRAPSASYSPEQQLAQIAESDRSVVYRNFDDRWVPQLSSKRPGTVDNGVTWDLGMALNEHQQLRQAYGARLLWSGQWSTFSTSNYWVTIADVSYPSKQGALAWCRGHGFDRDHCIAKLISTTHGVDGSTAYN